MSKIKQSVAVQRQIPEHIRVNYPAFVEFIKLYYEFLEETQSQNLEQIRDIDSTLEEFIDRFKSELAKNVPIELADDKRLLLRYIRQFYLSRGSEDSFKFIFKTLFGREAELFYPSTQMLRVSDGKWQQEISIFVRLTGSTPSLFPVDGKFINIITPRKTIQTFISGVSSYNDTTFELFIQRDYANEITVGSTVRFVDSEGAIYTGEIIACPSKIRVYKPGKGFRVGQLFSLKTSLGSGCLVKITKTDSEGGIQAVQPIKFGLDYVSKFYSYLSSKSIQAYEYVHPLEIGAGQSSYEEYTAAPTNGSQTFNLNYLIENSVPLVLVDVTRNNASISVSYTATNGTSITISSLQAGDIVKLYGVVSKGVAPAPNDPGYRDSYSGFVDYGFASMQTYMDYDPSIPVQRELVGNTLLDTRASDRFFADPSYVGDIVQQFYTDSSSSVFDDELAIIEIDIGAVARYPGYYRTSDGFISDEMYIQDGKYYQAFSYVIRVEEELRKYADIIRALVHPSGMKMFAEYDIFNQVIVSAGVPNIFRLLQFSDTIINISDTSYNYDAYVFQQNPDGSIEYVPAPGASQVFTQQNKAALFATKNLSDSTTEDVITRNLLNSNNQSVIIIDNYGELRDKGVAKPFTDVIAENYILLSANDSSGDPHDFHKNYSETYSKSVQKPFIETIQQNYTTVQANDSIGVAHNFIKNYSETHVKNYDKSTSDSTVENNTSTQTSDSSGIIHTFNRNYSETYAKSSQKPLQDTITERFTSVSTQDSATNSHTLIRSYEEGIGKLVNKPFGETVPNNNTTSTIEDSAGTTHQVILSHSETRVKNYTKAPTETIQAQFNRANNYIHSIVKPLVDAFSSLDEDPSAIAKLVEKSLTEAQSLVEAISKHFFKNPPGEILSISEEISKLVEKLHEESLSTSDSISKLIEKSLQDALSLLESIAKQFTKNLPDEVLSLSEEISKLIEKLHTDSLSTSEEISKLVQKPLQSDANVSDSSSRVSAKAFQEIVSLIDSYAAALEKIFADQFSAIDSYSLQPELNKSDSASIDPFEDVGLIKVPTTGSGEIRIHEALQFITDVIRVTKGVLAYEELFALDSGSTHDSQKTVSDSLDALVDSTSKGFTLGNIAEIITSLIDSSFSSYQKNPTESVSQSETLVRDNTKNLAESVPQSETQAKGFTLGTITEPNITQSDSISSNPNKGLSETVDQPTDVITNRDYTKNPTESVSQSETQEKGFTLGTITEPNITQSDSISSNSNKGLSETVTQPTDSIITDNTKNLVESISQSEAQTKGFTLGTISESVPQSETQSKGFTLGTIAETVTQPSDSYTLQPTKNPADVINTSMNGRLIFNPYDDVSLYPSGGYFESFELGTYLAATVTPTTLS